MLMRWKLEKISAPSSFRALGFCILAVLIGLITAGIVLAIIGFAPLSMGLEVVTYIFGTPFGLQDFGILITPLLLTGLAVMIAMRVNLWNIGGEGQFFLGAWAAAGVGIFFNGPAIIMLPAMFLAGAIAGAAWIALPALAKVRAGVDEIITTLLMNFVAILFVGYFSSGPWRDPSQVQIASSYEIQYALPAFFGIWNIGIFLVLAIIVLCRTLFVKTTWGFEARYVGANRVSAAYAGMPAGRRMLATMLLSGAIAGVAGMIEVSGTVSRLQIGISSQFGYLGIVIAALSMGSYIGLIVSAALMAMLLNAGIVFELQGLSLSAVVALTGWLLLLVGIGQIAAGYRLVRQAYPQGKGQVT